VQPNRGVYCGPKSTIEETSGRYGFSDCRHFHADIEALDTGSAKGVAALRRSCCKDLRELLHAGIRPGKITQGGAAWFPVEQIRVVSPRSRASDCPHIIDQLRTSERRNLKPHTEHELGIENLLSQTLPGVPNLIH
jgi:hypothetical protein